MNNKKFKNFGAKGYYIALILCACAIGISGYLYYRNASPNETQLQQEPTADADIQAVATNPTTDTEPTDGNAEERPLQTVGEYAVSCLAYNQTTRDWRTHDGIDIAAEAGAVVCAAAEGTVYSVYDDDTMGKTVVIRHANGYTTRYASLSEEVSVSPGDVVKLGQKIGTVGQTALLETAIGDHLHFSVSCDGASVDPLEFLPAE